jgi:predicted MFS family arabinose efflux permease
MVRLRPALSVLSVMLGIFSIVTTEILPIGLLPSVASSFRITDGTAGLMMTMPGFVAAVAAPVVTVATGRIDRRLMLCAFLVVLAVADFMAALAPAFWLMLVSRVLVGVSIGGFWSVGAGLAERLVPPEKTARATAVIFSAVPLGSVLGVPFGTLVGHLAGWRTAFATMGVLTLVVVVSLAIVTPPLPALQVTRARVLMGLFRLRPTKTGLVVTFLVVLAHFGTYTYVTPFLEEVSHVSAGMVTVFLLVYGGAGVVGNFVGGTAVAGNLRAAFTVAACMLAVATLTLPFLGREKAGAVVLLVVWGLAYGAVPVCSQTWFAQSSGNAPEAASVVFTSSFQATISLGALAGGVVVDAWSASTVMVTGGLVAVATAATVWWLGGYQAVPSDPPRHDRGHSRGRSRRRASASAAADLSRSVR